MSAFPVSGPGDVRVEIQMGNVDIVAGDRDDIVVTARPSNAERSGDRAAAERVRAALVGKTIVVTGPSRLGIFGPGDSVDLLVEVPTASDVDVTVKYGSLRLDGGFGEVHARVDYGDAVISSVERLEFRGGHGGIRVSRVAHDAEASLKSGTARIERVGGDLRLKNTDGASTVGAVDGSADIGTSSGSVELGTAGGSVTMRSAYGGISIRDLVRGVARLEASYGSIDVGVRRGTAVWLDATSSHGAVRTDLAADPGPVEGDDTLELHIRAGYGNISVSRSEAPSSL